MHKAGIIHRDNSPDNIMITREGEIKLLDFGAARDISTDGAKSLSVLLKPGYAPEEQYRTRGSQGPWTDVYALCATLYKAITGVTPLESMERLHQDDLKRPSALGIPISQSVEDALLKGLSIFQQDRYQSMQELYDALMDKKPMSHQPRQPLHAINDGSATVPTSVAQVSPSAPEHSSTPDTDELLGNAVNGNLPGNIVNYGGAAFQDGWIYYKNYDDGMLYKARTDVSYINVFMPIYDILRVGKKGIVGDILF